MQPFEAAVQAVVGGDLATLESLLKRDPELAHARSSSKHRATLLHYIAANGVEDELQKSPKNAVAVAQMLLQAGAEVDALADMYDGRYPALSMLVSSTPPAEAGLQIPLAETLLDHGADIEGVGEGKWRSPLMTALAFGFSATAEMLARRGARVDNIAAAAGLGRIQRVRELLPASDALSRHRAIALAAQHGRVEIVGLLLDAGEDPNRYNPDGNHSHSAPLHQAAAAGHLDVVRLLVERGARLDIRDTGYQSTPLGWAEHGGQAEVANYLRAKSAE